MRQSYTLVIPTYNRSNSLERLLRYLRSQQADFAIHVLDSSRPDEREANRRAIAGSGLDCEHVEYPEETHPFDKFREGISAVTTPLCALCADDDIPVVPGTRASVDFLLRNSDYGTAHGYYFQFAAKPREMRLANFTYYTPSIDMDEPLARIHALMRHYQALTYGTYRTEVLANVFDSVRPVGSILARELLSSALAAAQGKVARLPVIYHGRSLGPSASYQNWHPLEWLLRDGKGMFDEYASYRELLARAVLAESSNSYSKEDTCRIIDMIHMQYLVRHLPEHAFDHMILESLRGTSPDEIFRSPPVSMGLLRAANHFVPLDQDAKNAKPPSVRVSGSADNLPAATRSKTTRAHVVRALDRHTPVLASQLRRIKSYVDGARTPAPEVVSAPTAHQAASRLSVEMNTAVRRYRLAPAFLSPPGEFAIEIDDDAKLRLVASLDDYAD